MIQPIKQFRVTRLTMSGFKGYAEPQTFRFGNMNVISGHMGVSFDKTRHHDGMVVDDRTIANHDSTRSKSGAADNSGT